MVKRYVKKPVVIEALQYTGNNKDEIDKFVGDKVLQYEEDGVIIKTLEGHYKGSVGDYIIKGVEGEFYPCKQDIFHKTYDLVGD